MAVRLCTTLTWLLALQAPAQQQPVKRYALLVGCTLYPKAGINELYGPANDVKLWAGLLEKFGFPPDHVTTLSGATALTLALFQVG